LKNAPLLKNALHLVKYTAIAKNVAHSEKCATLEKRASLWNIPQLQKCAALEKLRNTWQIILS